MSTNHASAATAQSPEFILSQAHIRDALIHNPPAVNVGPAETSSPILEEAQDRFAVDEWDELLSRLLNIVQHLKLVDQRLYDFQSIPPDIEPAAIVVHDAVDALDTLREEFDEWHATHARAPKRLPADEKAEGSPSDAVNLKALLERVDRHEATLDEMAAVADELDLPLWVMMVPGLQRENIEHHMQVVRGLVDGYIAGRQSANTASVQGASETAGAAILPQLASHLLDQQQRVAELHSLLEQLWDEDENTPMCTRIAVRMAAELGEALDRVTLGKVVAKEAQP